MRVIECPDDISIADCYVPLSPAAIKWLVASPRNGKRIGAVARYHENLTGTEVSAILDAGLGLFTVGIARNDSMTMPTAFLGQRDAEQAIADLDRLNIPAGVTCALDVEGTVHARAADIAGYANAWAHTLGSRAEPALYEGWGIPLSAIELYRNLVVRLYWASSTASIEPAERGFALVQAEHNVPSPHGVFDYSTPRADRLGSRIHILTS